MKKFAFLIAAAACVVMGPALIQPVQADPSIRIGIGESHDGWRHRGLHSNASVVVVGNRHHCRTVVTRIHRHGKIIIKRERRCR